METKITNEEILKEFDTLNEANQKYILEMILTIKRAQKNTEKHFTSSEDTSNDRLRPLN